MRRWALVFLLGVVASWGGWTVYKRHREAVREQQVAAWQAQFSRAVSAFVAARYPEPQGILEAMLPETEEKFSNAPPLASTLNLLAMSYAAQRQYLSAEPLFLRALEVRKRALPADSPDLAQTLEGLGQLYRDEGHAAEAEVYYRQLLPI